MEKSLKDWYERIVIKRPELGGMAICPFAKKGVEDKKAFMYPIGNDPKEFILKKIEDVKCFEIIVFYNENNELNNKYKEMFDLENQISQKGKLMSFNVKNEIDDINLDWLIESEKFQNNEYQSTKRTC